MLFFDWWLVGGRLSKSIGVIGYCLKKRRRLFADVDAGTTRHYLLGDQFSQQNSAAWVVAGTQGNAIHMAKQAMKVIKAFMFIITIIYNFLSKGTVPVLLIYC